MGQSKVKKAAPCRCGSGQPAATCCWTPNGWRKAPKPISLTGTGEHGAHEKCYLRGTNACSTKITGEHPVSEAVLKVLADRELEVSGLPWLKGDKKILRFSALTANCLCSAHSNALSPIDAIGGQFFSALQQCATSGTGLSRHFLFSGHDIERWLMKVIAGFAASKGFAIDGAVLDGAAPADMDFAELLADDSQWKPPLGVYSTQRPGDKFTQRNQVSMSPLLVPGGNLIVGMMADIQGFHLGLLASAIRERDISSRKTRIQNRSSEPRHPAIVGRHVRAY
jgi:hypothetical protein